MVTPSAGLGALAASCGASGLPRGLRAVRMAAGGSTLARLAVAGSGPACRPAVTASSGAL